MLYSGKTLKRAFMSEMSSKKTDTVLVVGGAGFLGKSIVKHLQAHGDTVREIRVLDVRPYEDTDRADDEDRWPPVISYVGDIRKIGDLQRATQGCSVVFHAASVIQVGTCVDVQFVHDVNVKGTENVIQACIDQNVQYLVYTGSVDAFKVFKEELNLSEDNLVYRNASELAFPEYGGSKMAAEKLVIRAHKKKSSTGDVALSTVVLRPTGIYGEGQTEHGVYEVLKNCNKRGGVLVPVSGMIETLWQISYVGNVAWAHVVTWKAMRADSSVGGQGYFITDDTPIENYVNFNRRFVEARGFRVSNRTYPKLLIVIIVYLLVFICALMRPIKRIRTDITPRTIQYMSHSATYNGEKLRRVTGYVPLYTAEEAFKRSLKFYKSILL